MRTITTVAVLAALATPAAALQVVNVLGQHSTPLNNSVLTNGAPYFDEEKDNQLGLAANFGAPFVNQEKDDQRGYGADAASDIQLIAESKTDSKYGAPFVNQEKDDQLGYGFGAPYFDEEKDNQLGLAFGYGAPYFDEEKDNQLG